MFRSTACLAESWHCILVSNIKMTSSPFTAALAPAINHLIAQEKWAQALLLKHEKKTIVIALPFTALSFVVQDGYFAVAENEAVPTVRIEVSSAAIWAFLKEGKAAAMKFVTISGDVDFAADVNLLVANLRWEAEEDLAKLIGDGPSHVLFKESQKIHAQGQAAIADLKHNVLDYVVNEKKAVLGLAEFNQFKADLRVLRDDGDRLEKKIVLLERSLAKLGKTT